MKKADYLLSASISIKFKNQVEYAIKSIYSLQTFKK